MPRSKKNGTSGIDYLGRPTTSHGALAAAVRINCHIAYHRPFANLTPNQRFEAHKRLEQDFRDWKGRDTTRDRQQWDIFVSKDEPKDQRRRRYEIACDFATSQPSHQAPEGVPTQLPQEIPTQLPLQLPIQQPPPSFAQSQPQTQPLQMFSQTFRSQSSVQHPPQHTDAFAQLLVAYTQLSEAFTQLSGAYNQLLNDRAPQPPARQAQPSLQRTEDSSMSYLSSAVGVAQVHALAPTGIPSHLQQFPSYPKPSIGTPARQSEDTATKEHTESIILKKESFSAAIKSEPNTEE